ncbi:MAG: lipid A biosynthesis lauroyl acyltransferase [Gammaproteobacteria bacterium]|nr:MAG: lipid A biosynthesis lauroyl acyltransferase [Gammaproteobacteria bacterium]
MSNSTSLFRLEFLYPRFWPNWLLFGCMALIGRLPYSITTKIGRFIGHLVFYVGRRRRQTAQINIDLCFPELNDAERERLLREHFLFMGIAAVETGICWLAPKAKLQKLLKEIKGEEHLNKALEAGHGAILLSCHFTHLEMGGSLLAGYRPLAAVYKPHKNNPLFEAVMLGSRDAHGRVISRSDTRGMLRTLRDNLPLWYAPDQNYKGKFAVFAPFFGINASTNAATSRLAKISKAPVLPFFQERMEDGSGYRLIIKPPLENFPSESAQEDAARTNALFEEEIRRRPAEYLWVHRRFKTRPPGEEKIYPKK